MTSKKKQLEQRFYDEVVMPIMDEYPVGEPKREFRFHPTRQFRADFCWPEYELVVEVQGGVFTRGKHGRASGIISDYKRCNEIAIIGWHVLQFDVSQIREGIALNTLKRFFEERI